MITVFLKYSKLKKLTTGITAAKALTIISPQNSHQYDSKQRNNGISVGYDFATGIPSGSVSDSRSDINANYRSINADSGQRDSVLSTNNAKANQLAQQVNQHNQDQNAIQAMLSAQSGFYANDEWLPIKQLRAL